MGRLLGKTLGKYREYNGVPNSAHASYRVYFSRVHFFSRILVSFFFIFYVFLVANIACCIRNRNENENLAKLICCTCASLLPQSGEEGGRAVEEVRQVKSLTRALITNMDSIIVYRTLYIPFLDGP